MEPVQVDLGGGVVEEVQVDPRKGPLLLQRDGSFTFLRIADNGWAFNSVGVMDTQQHAKAWEELGVTDRNVMLSIAARKNRAMLQLGPAKMQELPDFLRGFAPQSWGAEEQNSFFASMSRPADQGLVGKLADEPILVVFYSGGMSKQQGKDLVAEFLETAKAKGLTDQVVLDHPEQYDIKDEGTDGWPRYLDALQRELDGTPDRLGRPVLIWGHSKGATAAMTLAARLGSRVLKVYVCASAAPNMGEVSPFQTMAANFKKGTDLDLLKWFCTQNSDRALHRMVEACDKGELTVESSPYLQGKLSLMKKQYVNCIYPDMERDFQVIHSPVMALWPSTDLSSPKEGMEAWQVWTTGDCEVKKVSAGHMDCLRVREHHDYVVADMVRVAKEGARR
mmetsp:Transcript_707/g.2051  ORF Transcript_707/g.2051 Transcript_707/m.2051 type:complete len:392 (+) Transcript_707:56-1231(+)